MAAISAAPEQFPPFFSHLHHHVAVVVEYNTQQNKESRAHDIAVVPQCAL